MGKEYKYWLSRRDKYARREKVTRIHAFVFAVMLCIAVAIVDAYWVVDYGIF